MADPPSPLRRWRHLWVVPNFKWKKTYLHLFTYFYYSYGTKDVLERECKNLDQILELVLDDQKIELPNVESVVILNIPCWGAGVRPWTLGQDHKNFPKPAINDGCLEVFCIYSSFHIAQMQVSIKWLNCVFQ